MIYLTAFIKWYITDNRPRSSLRGQWYILSKISNQDPHSFSNLASKSWTWLALSISTRQSQTNWKFPLKIQLEWHNLILLSFPLVPSELKRKWLWYVIWNVILLQTTINLRPEWSNPYTFSDRWIGHTYFSRLELTRNWIAFSIELIYWYHIFSVLWGKENFW